MNTIPFIPKEDAELPDSYGIEVTYVDKVVEKFEAVSHNRVDIAAPYLEILTFDDCWLWVPLACVKILKFDKRFSKILELKNKARTAQK